MPIKRTAQQRESQPPREQEAEVARAERPEPEPVEAGPVQPGRLYQAFVESETRKFWQEMVNVGSLTKPAKQEIRAAAMPILCQAPRRRLGRKLHPYLDMAHQAVADVVERAREQRWTKRPLSEPYASPDYVDALIQLADDADWLAREVPLPEHPSPKQPPIYYTMDLKGNKPVPRENSLIRGDYVYAPWSGARVTDDDQIYPWISSKHYPEPSREEFSDLGLNAGYTLEYEGGKIKIIINWFELVRDIPVRRSTPLGDLHFSPHPPSIPDSSRD